MMTPASSAHGGQETLTGFWPGAQQPDPGLTDHHPLFACGDGGLHVLIARLLLQQQEGR